MGTPLHRAATAGHSKAVQTLIDAGANKEAKTLMDQTALHLAAENGEFGVLQLLLVSGANTEAETSNGEPPLHIAVVNQQGILVKELLLHGANKMATDRYGKSPLDLADDDLIRQLLGDSESDSSSIKNRYPLQGEGFLLTSGQRRTFYC